MAATKTKFMGDTKSWFLGKDGKEEDAKEDDNVETSTEQFEEITCQNTGVNHRNCT